MDIPKFRLQFPEFANTSDFPDAMIDFWAGVAANLVNRCRFRDMYDYAIALVVAHHLALALQNIRAAEVGALPGTTGTGLTSNKSVGSVSVGYDNSSVVHDSGAEWNLTIYGRQYLTLVNLFGQGAMQLS